MTWVQHAMKRAVHVFGDLAVFESDDRRCARIRRPERGPGWPTRAGCTPCTPPHLTMACVPVPMAIQPA